MQLALPCRASAQLNAGQYTGTGRLYADGGGTLSVFGTVNSGIVLQLGTAANSILRIEGTATSAAAIVTFGGPSSISDVDQRLEIGASGSLTINAAQSVTQGTIKLDGGTLIAAAGLTIGSSGDLTGFGTVAANIAAGVTAGVITASGGVLNLTGTVASGNTYTIANTAWPRR